MITPIQIEKLREDVSSVLTEKRMNHVLAVEKMSFRLGLLYFFGDDESLMLLRVAALLHDVTKEISDGEQLDILKNHNIEPLPEELASMPTIHALTAAVVIPERFPAFADERVLNAVRYHTTGREGMSIFEKIIFLADFIDETRTYPNCIALRNDFFAANPEYMDYEERVRHLDRAALRSIEDTLAHLRGKGRAIHPLTLSARADLKARLER